MRTFYSDKDARIVSFERERRNFALEYWHDFVEQVTLDKDISPRDMAEMLSAMRVFVAWTEDAPDIKRILEGEE